MYCSLCFSAFDILDIFVFHVFCVDTYLHLHIHMYTYSVSYPMVHTIQRAVPYHSESCFQCIIKDKNCIFLRQFFIELKGVGIGEYVYGIGKIR